jgi:hypothetical protein
MPPLLAVISREPAWVVGFAARDAHLAVISGTARYADDDGPLGTPEGAQWPIIFAGRVLLAVIRGRRQRPEDSG